MLPSATFTPWENIHSALDAYLDASVDARLAPKQTTIGEITVRLIQWRPDESADRIARLEGAGYTVMFDVLTKNDATQVLLADVPDAFVIDLTSLPALGRQVGVFLRRQKATRSLPLVFVGGEPNEVDEVRELLPSSTFSHWEDAVPTLAETIGAVVTANVPVSAADMSSDIPLHFRLGIDPGFRVGLVGAPEGFEDRFDDLPPGASITRQINGQFDRIIWFSASRLDLQANAEVLANMLSDTGGLWMVWPEKSSGMASNVGEDMVRKVGSAAGMIDYGIAAIDSTWSELLFARRLERRQADVVRGVSRRASSAIEESGEAARSRRNRATSGDRAAPLQTPVEQSAQGSRTTAAGSKSEGKLRLETLGIGHGSRITLIGAPEGFESSLAEQFEGATFVGELEGRFDRIIWFTASRVDFRSDIGAIATYLTENGGIWVAWPKQSSGIRTDLDESVVREIGLVVRLVEQKVADIEANWSGMLFTRS